MGNELTITLKINSQGEAVVKQITGDLQKVGQTGQKALGDIAQGSAQAKGQLDGILTSLDSQAARWLSVAGATYLAYKAVNSWYSLISAGVSTVDDYQKKIIGTSYILATMSEVKPPELSKAYGQWKDYFDWMYRQSLRVDKMAASSGMEINAVGIELAKKGVKAATDEEMNVIGRLTDLMKAVTPGYMNFEQQARGEIMAMMEGTARMGAQTAQILSQIDPEFKKNITSAREQGTVLKYIESILPQIKQYTLDLMGTWDAAGASLKSAWSVINLKAFGDAHKDVVKYTTELGNRLVDNGKLTADGEKLALALGQAWAMAKESIGEALDYILNNSDEIISDIRAIASATGTITGFAVDVAVNFVKMVDSMRQGGMNIQVVMVQVRAAIDYTIEWFGILGTTAKAIVHDVIYNFWGFSKIPAIVNQAYADMEGASKKWSEAAIQDANNVRFATMNAMQAGTKPKGFVFMGGESEQLPLAKTSNPNAPPTPPVRPFTGKEPKGKSGDGGVYAEASRLASLFDTLNKDIARLSEGKLAAIKADYIKTVDQIYKKTEVRAVSEAELEVLAKQRATLQKTKLQDDFNLKMAKGSGDAFLEINEQYKQDLLDYGGIGREKEKLDAMYGRQRIIKQAERTSEELNLQKTYVDAMASASPIIADQLVWKRRSLDLEHQLAQAAITKMVAEKPYLAYLEGELRAREAMTVQTKKFNLEMENNKGLSGWAYGRAKEADQRNTVKDMMGGLESGLQNGFSTAWQGFLSQDKQNLAKAGRNIFQGFLGQLNQGSLTKVFDFAAKLKAPQQPSLSASGNGQVAGGQTGSNYAAQMGQAAQGLKQASIGFNLNTAQFGLAAGGLLLSGVGIATNSQSLVIAGTVLQLAGLAIQLYQALTATTTAMEMTFAAGALSGAAGSLSAAAGMLMAVSFKQAIPIIGHTGLELPRFHLGSDEIPAILQKGEWVLNRNAVSALRDTYGPGAFKMFNSGQVPAVMAPVRRRRDPDAGQETGSSESPSQGQPPVIHLHYNPSFSAIDAKGMKQLIREHRDDLFKEINGKLRDGARFSH